MQISKQKKPFDQNEISLIKKRLRSKNMPRDLAMFCTGLDTMLRTSDLRDLTVSTITNSRGEIQSEFYLKQTKTKNNVKCFLGEETREILKGYILEKKLARDDRLFNISHAQHTRLVKKWAGMIGLCADDYSTHSIRRTLPSIIYAKTKNIEVVRQLLGHNNINSTTAYLGIGQVQTDEIAREFIK